MSNFVLLPKIQNGRHYFKAENFLKFGQRMLQMYPGGSKFLTKLLYLAPLRRYKQFCVFAENSKWPPFFGTQKFLKFGQSILPWYPWGRKFRRNRFISHRLGDISNFVLMPKIQKFKMAAIFRRTKKFWNLGRVFWWGTLGVGNFDESALSRTFEEIASA